MRAELILSIIRELEDAQDKLVVLKDEKKMKWSANNKITPIINSLRSIIEVMEVIERWEEQ